MNKNLATGNTALRIRSILVIDDHPLFCEAIAMTLQSILELVDVRTANSLTEGLEILESGFEAGAIVLDLNLPDVSGVDGLLKLRSKVPKTPIVVVSALGDRRIVTAVMAAGASGFIKKDAPREELTESFQKIWAGETCFPEDLTGRPGYVDEAAELELVVKRLASLTPQQVTILKLVCQGKLNKQIAYDLSIAETTVKAHITATLRKLGVHSRTQAALLAKEAEFSALLNQDIRAII
jgi:DNA-binding NarL/FixJ family response regulator